MFIISKPLPLKLPLSSQTFYGIYLINLREPDYHDIK